MYRIVQKGFTLSGSFHFVNGMQGEFGSAAPVQKLEKQEWRTLKGSVIPIFQSRK